MYAVDDDNNIAQIWQNCCWKSQSYIVNYIRILSCIYGNIYVMHLLLSDWALCVSAFTQSVISNCIMKDSKIVTAEVFFAFNKCEIRYTNTPIIYYKFACPSLFNHHGSSLLCCCTIPSLVHSQNKMSNQWNYCYYYYYNSGRDFWLAFSYYYPFISLIDPFISRSINLHGWCKDDCNFHLTFEVSK